MEKARWRLRDYLVAAGLLLSFLLVIGPIAATYAGLIDVDLTTGLLTVVLAGCVGFLALDSIPGRWCPVREHRHRPRFAIIVTTADAPRPDRRPPGCFGWGDDPDRRSAVSSIAAVERRSARTPRTCLASRGPDPQFGSWLTASLGTTCSARSRTVSASFG